MDMNTDTPTPIDANTAAQPTGSATPEKARKFETVDLVEPIRRGERVIDALTLRKPKAGELRGLTLSDLIGLDIGTIIKVIPRISDPVPVSYTHLTLPTICSV